MTVELNALEQLRETPPFSLPQAEKRRILTSRVRELTQHHYERCKTYRNLIHRVFGGKKALEFTNLEDAPFLPVSLFKTQELRSTEADKVVKVVTSSGTTGQAVSRIYLDAETAQLQSQAMVKITQHFVGVQRRPLIVVDHSSAVRNRGSYSARGAAIMAMLLFGRRPFYCLREDFSLDLEGLAEYLHQNSDLAPIFFGVTYVVWKYFLEPLARAGQRLTVPKDSMLLHTGGWKKLQNQSVSPKEFRQTAEEVADIHRVASFYGMAEQVGSVFFENDLHFLQASNYSDVIIRDANTLEPLPHGQEGLVQVVSSLPVSYPGHSLLTEDLGVLRGEGQSGMQGQYFELVGRLPEAELRGCSDTFQERARQ